MNWTKLSPRCLDTKGRSSIFLQQKTSNKSTSKTAHFYIPNYFTLYIRSFPSAIVYSMCLKNFRWVQVAEFTKIMLPSSPLATSKPWFLTKSLRLFNSPSHDNSSHHHQMKNCHPLESHLVEADILFYNKSYHQFSLCFVLRNIAPLFFKNSSRSTLHKNGKDFDINEL